jgi:hypothetical protein
MHHGGKRAVYIYASEVAACVGKHPYKAQTEAFMNVLRRMDPKACDRAARDMPEDDATVLQRVLETAPHVRQEIQTTAKNTTDRHDVEQAVRACVQKVEEESSAGLSPAEKDSVERAIRSTVQTNVGTVREGGVLAAVNRASDLVFVQDQKLYKKCLGRHKDRDWFVCGRVDGMSADGTVVLEIKNRMRRLFGRVVEYERIQMLCYQMMCSVQNGVLVEALGDDQLMTHPIEWDPAEWDDICEGLRSFAIDVIEALE